MKLLFDNFDLTVGQIFVGQDFTGFFIHNNNNSFICMTIGYYSIAKAYNSTKRTYNVINI